MDLTVANYTVAFAQPFYAVPPYLRTALIYPDPLEYFNSYYKYYDGEICISIMIIMFLMKIFLYSVYVIADKYVCQNAQISRSSATIPIAIFANDVFVLNKGN